MNKLSVSKLKKLCKQNKHIGYSNMCKKDLIKLLNKSSQVGGGKLLILPYIKDNKTLNDLLSLKKVLGYKTSNDELQLRKKIIKDTLLEHIDEVNLTNIILDNLVKPKQIVDIKPLITSTYNKMKKFEKHLPMKNQKNLINFGEIVLFDAVLFLQILYKEYSKTQSNKQLKDIMNLKKKLFLDRHTDIKKYILNHDLLHFKRKLKKWLNETKNVKFVGKYMEQGYPKNITAFVSDNKYERMDYSEYSHGSFEQSHSNNFYDFETAINVSDIKKIIRTKRGFFEVNLIDDVEMDQDVTKWYNQFH